jgi:Uma2 family endonuclease
MTALQKNKMTADEFLAWAAARQGESEDGRLELIDGEVIAMAPERVRHLEAKASAYVALAAAIRRIGASCFVLPDGASVRIDAWTVFEPDALVYCGERLGGDEVIVPNPLIVVEVLSPSTAYNDLGRKLTSYFMLLSVLHYLIIDPERRVVIHHARGSGDMIMTRIVSHGTIKLDPPGLEMTMADLLPSPGLDERET